MFISDGSRESSVTTKYFDVNDDYSDNDQSLNVSLFLLEIENFQERIFRNSINQIQRRILIDQHGIMLLMLKNHPHLM